MKPTVRIRIRTGVWFTGLLAALVFTSSCGRLSEGPPTDVVLSAASDTTVRISWTAPAGGVPDSYVVAFMETGTSTWQDFGTATDSAVKADHNPLGRTGRYRVTAIYGGASYPATDAPSSAPVHTGAAVVGELNSLSYSGYGWNRDSGAGAVFTMSYASNADRVDFYVTDWATGFAGPAYSIASPDWGAYEPGGSGFVPVGRWRATGFSSLSSGGQAPLPHFNSGIYGDYLELNPDSTLAAVVCTDTIVTADTTDTFVTVSRHYALVKLGSPDAVSGTVQVETWFQAIRDLRLIQH